MIHFLSKFVFMCLLLLLSCLTMFFQNVIAFSSIVLTRASIPPGHNLPNAEWCRIHQKSEEEEEEEVVL
jgi:hypothetical protein